MGWTPDEKEGFRLEAKRVKEGKGRVRSLDVFAMTLFKYPLSIASPRL